MKTKAKRKAPARKRLAWFIDFHLGGPDAVGLGDGPAPPEEFDRVADALWLASGRDATIAVRCGQLWVIYTKEAATLDQALASALADFSKAGLKLDILKVEIEPVAPPARRRKQRRAS